MGGVDVWMSPIYTNWPPWPTVLPSLA